jgi:hypothetical protein
MRFCCCFSPRYSIKKQLCLSFSILTVVALLLVSILAIVSVIELGYVDHVCV